MCSSIAPRLWFLTDRRIREDYPQQEILRALKAKCCEEDLDFRALVMDEVVLTVEQGNLGLRVNGELITAYPQVVVVRVPTPWVQSDSDITVLRHLEKMGCRLMNRPQAILNCVNKFWTFQELAGHGVPLPDTFSYGGHENFAKMIDEAEVLEFPMVVKNTRGHRDILKGKRVLITTDNTAAVYHIRKQGGTRSARLSRSHQNLDLGHLQRGSFVSNSYCRGTELLARCFKQRCKSGPGMVSCDRIPASHFSAMGNASHRSFCHVKQYKCHHFYSRGGMEPASLYNAFCHCWVGFLFYVFPPFGLISRMVTKLVQTKRIA